MRSKKALINAIFGMCGYLILMVSNFITRSVFIKTLGMSMAGVDTTFKNFLQVLSLAELGLSTGLIYKLYRPIEEKNNSQIKRILNFYKRAYRIISVVFMGGAFILSLIVPFFVHDADKSYLYLAVLFVLYAADTVASYLFANRKALIVADQNNYLVNRNDAFISLITVIFQVILLYLTKSFIVYALVKIACRLIGASLIGQKFKKMYPEIANNKSREMIEGEERSALLKNMGAMLCHKIGGVSVTASGSAVISAMLGTVQSGIYGNYVLITNTLLMLITQIFSGVTASFGNVLTVEDKNTVYKKFNMLYFFNYLIISFCTVSVSVLIQPFMRLWIGNSVSNLFSSGTVAVLVCYFYVYGMRRVVLMTKDSAGLYRPDRYCAVLEASLNIVLSVLLVYFTENVRGLILANLISMLIIPFWTQPILVYKRILGQNPIHYYIRYLFYTILTLVMTFLTLWLTDKVVVTQNIFIELFFRGIICLIVPNVINIIVFFKSEEMQNIIAMLKGIFKK